MLFQIPIVIGRVGEFAEMNEPLHHRPEHLPTATNIIVKRMRANENFELIVLLQNFVARLHREDRSRHVGNFLRVALQSGVQTLFRPLETNLLLLWRQLLEKFFVVLKLPSVRISQIQSGATGAVIERIRRHAVGNGDVPQISTAGDPIA